jgi:hypothetical protein
MSDSSRPTRRDVLRFAMALSLAGSGKAFAMRDVTGRLLVDVQVNGQGPFPFLLDTTASQSALSPQLATRLALDTGSGSARITLLETGALRLSDVQLPVITGDAIGAADGVLGIEGMDRKRIEADFRKDSVSIGATNDGRAPIGFRIAPARERRKGLLAVEATVATLRVTAILATAATHSQGNPALQAALKDAAATPLPITVAGAMLGQVYLKYGDDDAFQSLELGARPALLLGMDVLGFLERLAIDYRRYEFQFRA